MAPNGNKPAAPGATGLLSHPRSYVVIISGTFATLPDGSTFTVGPNTFQANYEGGTGNDLTPTVVP